MNTKSKLLFDKLESLYQGFGDKDSLNALHELLEVEETAREAVAYRTLPLTQKFLREALKRYQRDLIAISTQENMTELERKARIISMDWAKWYIDTLGDNPDVAKGQVDEMVAVYAKKAGISTD